MIRLTALLRRHPALSRDAFDAHWRTTHAGLVAAVPGVDSLVARYEQHPRLEDAPGRWTGTSGFDGMAVQWFRHADDLAAFVADPAYRAHVAPDERRLLDLEGSVFLVTDEPRVVLET